MHRNQNLFGNYEYDISIYIRNEFLIFGFVFMIQFLLGINYNFLLSSDLSAEFVNRKQISYIEPVSNKYIVNNVIIDMDKEIQMEMRTIKEAYIIREIMKGVENRQETETERQFCPSLANCILHFFFVFLIYFQLNAYEQEKKIKYIPLLIKDISNNITRRNFHGVVLVTYQTFLEKKRRQNQCSMQV